MERKDIRNNKTEYLILGFYLLTFVTLASALALMQPLADTAPIYANPPDEHARYLVPRFICQNGYLPTGFEPEVQIPAYGFSYALYSMLPYIVQGYVMRFFAVFCQTERFLLYVGRFVDVLFGLGSACMTYLCSRRVFDTARTRWIFCFMTMFLPQHLFVYSYINTDALALFAVSVILYALICGYQEGFRIRDCVLLATGISICALSYYNTYGYLLFSVVLAFGYYLIPEKSEGRRVIRWKEMLSKAALVIGIVFLCTGWWYIRSYRILDGDLFGFATRERMMIAHAIDAVNPLYKKSYCQQGYTLLQMLHETDYINKVVTSFIARFGSMSILGSPKMYVSIKAVLGLGLLGAMLPMKRVGGRRCLFILCMLGSILFSVGILVYYAYTDDFQYQGRYILPAVMPLMYFAAIGLENWGTLMQRIGEKITSAENCLKVRRVASALVCLMFVVWSAHIIFRITLPICIQVGFRM